MQKFFLILLIGFLPGALYAQSSFLKDAVIKLDKALIEKDTAILKQLLHNNLSYGHSNGWVQTKSDVSKDIVTAKLIYKNIESKNLKWTVNNNVATLRNSSNVSYELDGKPGELHLHILQVWLKTNKGWQLLTRQSTKL